MKDKKTFKDLTPEKAQKVIHDAVLGANIDLAVILGIATIIGGVCVVLLNCIFQ